MVIDLKVILRQFLYPMNVTRTETFCIYKLIEVIMVSKDKNLIFAAFQVVTPSFENLNDG